MHTRVHQWGSSLVVCLVEGTRGLRRRDEHHNHHKILSNRDGLCVFITAEPMINGFELVLNIPVATLLPLLSWLSRCHHPLP